MRRHRLLVNTEEVCVAQVRCDGHERRWGQAEEVSTPGLVLVRIGVFRRRADGVEAVLDPTTAYVQRPGEVQQVSHPAGGDLCTSMTISPEIAERLPASGQLRVTAEVDLTHRLLVARAGSGADPVELGDRSAELVAAVVAEPVPMSRTRLVEDARALLNAQPALPLTRLAAELGVSSWYLSRLFHRVTGTTVSRYRLRLRVRAALERFLEESDGPATRSGLAEIAAELGFADQAHLTRVLGAETGRTPAALRDLLGPT
ncbi:MAG: AraC family transcriptional regulator [Sporichthyaceae bacterium]|nr:AraC family transcriptional regulator [Sporichthyaceae bacterium]